MQAYLFVLLCLTSLVSVVSFDAARARKHCLCVKISEGDEQLFSAQKSMHAEIAYRDKIKGQASSGEKESIPKKTVNITTGKKHKLRLLSIPFSRPPNNSRFNLYAFLQESPEERANTVSWYAIFARLLKRVYVDAGQIPEGTEYKILEALLSKKEEILEGGSRLGEDTLSILTLPVTEAKLLYTILRGSKQAPSLLNFLCYEEKPKGYCKLNLLFADPLLLQAVVNHPEAYEKIRSAREEVWHAVKYQEQAIQEQGQAAALEFFKTRTDFRIELRDKIHILLSHYHLLDLLNKKLFDYTLGSAGDYAYLTHPETGEVIRSRCHSKFNKS